MRYGGNPQCQGQAFLLPVFVGTTPFQGRVFLQLAFCRENAPLQQLLSHMAMVCLSTNCLRNVFYCDLEFVLEFVLEFALEFALEVVLESVLKCVLEFVLETIFHACKKSAVSKKSLSTASLCGDNTVSRANLSTAGVL